MKNLKSSLKRLITKNQKGLSLIEILLTLTLIALFGAIVGTQVMKSFDEGKMQTTKIQITQLEASLDDFKRKCGFYPTTEMGLEALVTKPTGKECANWTPSLKPERIPNDAWGNTFDYSYSNGKIIVRSFGGDGKEGGEGEDVDISNEAK